MYYWVKAISMYATIGKSDAVFAELLEASPANADLTNSKSFRIGWTPEQDMKETMAGSKGEIHPSLVGSEIQACLAGELNFMASDKSNFQHSKQICDVIAKFPLF
jgi:hypothetical protein